MTVDNETEIETGHASGMKQFKGLPAFVAMKIGTKVDSHQIISSLLKIHDVENVFEVTGEYDIIAIVRAKVSS